MSPLPLKNVQVLVLVLFCTYYYNWEHWYLDVTSYMDSYSPKIHPGQVLAQQHNYLSLQRGCSERRMSLHDLHEQGNPLWRAEGGTHVRRESNTAHEAQRAPAPVLFPAHLPVWGSCQSETD